MFNDVVLLGRLATDPELRYVPSGKAVAQFNLAVDRGYSGSKQDVDFIPIVCWEKIAEAVTEHRTKGDMLLVRGRLQIRTYQGSDGQKRKVAEVVAAEAKFIGKSKANGAREQAEPQAPAPAAPAAADAPEEEEVPF